MKIPFDLTKWLSDKSQKVVTRDGKPVRIICTDCECMQPIVALVQTTEEHGVIVESVETFTEKGRYYNNKSDSGIDLFLITEEPELTEFEERLAHLLCLYNDCASELTDIQLATFKEDADKLLALARKQLKAEGWEYTDPLFKECLADNSKTLQESSTQDEPSDDSGQLETEINRYWEEIFDDDCGNYFKAVEEAAKHFYNLGKAEALKDLPKWKKMKPTGIGQIPSLTPLADGDKLLINKSYFIKLSDIEKLQKED